MKTDIPSRMQAVSIDSGGKLVTIDLDVPGPGKGEVLVKMLASPINPTDLARIREFDPAGGEGFMPGTEGSGIVVAAGKGILPSLYNGKRVAFAAKYPHSGTWAEYVVTPAGSCFPISKKVSDEQASMALVNPMTALAFLHYAKKFRQKAIVLTAANSALARMTRELMEKHNIRVMNVVRSEISYKELHDRGCIHILNSSMEGFAESLGEWCRQHQTGLIFDAVGGEFINEVLGILPPKMTILLYGNLSKLKVEFLPPQIVRKNININGFFLGTWIEQQGLIRTVINLRKVNKMLKAGMETSVQASFPLTSVQEAVETYEAGMSAGKVILRGGSTLQ